ncbi:hypothetical protein PIB30_109589, partial [Stylosanthes scabra]|nr:hypothetical protein [Stylosanthes scabra]
RSTHRPFLCVNTPRPPTSKNHVCATFQSNYELATISCPSWPSHAVRAHKQAVKPRSSKMWVNKRWLTNPMFLHKRQDILEFIFSHAVCGCKLLYN